MLEIENAAYSTIMNTLADHLQVNPENDIITLPPHKGQGFIQGKFFEKGFYAFQVDVTLHQGISIFRKVSMTKDMPWCINFYLPNERHKKIIQGQKINTSSVLFFISPQMGTETRITPRIRFRKLTIMMSPTWISKYLAMESLGTLTFIRDLLKEDKAFYLSLPMTCNIENPLYQFLNTENSPLLKQLFYKSKAMELVALALEHINGMQRNETHTQDKDIYPHQARKALMENISLPPNIPQMAKDLGVSQTKLRTGFKKTFGESIYHFLHRARMQKAAELLGQQNLSVAEVGHKVGYSNLSYFSEVFKKVYGILPSAYAKGNPHIKNGPKPDKPSENMVEMR